MKPSRHEVRAAADRADESLRQTRQPEAGPYLRTRRWAVRAPRTPEIQLTNRIPANGRTIVIDANPAVANHAVDCVRGTLRPNSYGPDPRCNQDGRLSGFPKTKKARRPLGHRADIRSGNILCVHRCSTKGTAQTSASSNSRYHPKSSRLGQRGDSRVVIAERFAQHVLCVLAKQRGGDGIDDRRQAESDRRFDIGD